MFFDSVFNICVVYVVGVFEYDIKHHYETKSACDSSELSAAEVNLQNSVKTASDCRNEAEDEGENLLPSRVSDDSADSNIRYSQNYSLKNAAVVCINTSLEECSTSSHDEDKSQMDLTSDKKTGLVGISSDNMEKKQLNASISHQGDIFFQANS